MGIPRYSANLRFFATAILHFNSKTHDMDGSALNYSATTNRCSWLYFSWNLPLYLPNLEKYSSNSYWKHSCGKTFEITPYTAFLFSKFVKKLIFQGCNKSCACYGDTAGHEIVKGADVVSFTGGAETGKIIVLVAKVLKSVLLNLVVKTQQLCLLIVILICL